jgi:hypothetical protein
VTLLHVNIDCEEKSVPEGVAGAGGAVVHLNGLRWLSGSPDPEVDFLVTILISVIGIFV